jgi:hypothetical protein
MSHYLDSPQFPAGFAVEAGLTGFPNGAPLSLVCAGESDAGGVDRQIQLRILAFWSDLLCYSRFRLHSQHTPERGRRVSEQQ